MISPEGGGASFGQVRSLKEPGRSAGSAGLAGLAVASPVGGRWMDTDTSHTAEVPEFDSASSRRKRFLSIGVLALCFGAAALVHSQYEFELDPRVLRERIADFGWLAPAVFVVAAAARIFLVLPSWVFMTVGGLLFGVWGGVLWGSVGFTLGAVATFAVARGLGRDALAHRLRGRAARFDRYVSERGAPWLALYTAVPVSLLTPVHFGSGLSGIGLLPFTLAAVCGFIPRTALYSFFGDAIAQNDWSGAGLALGIIVVAGALGIVLARRWRRGRGDESLPASAE